MRGAIKPISNFDIKPFMKKIFFYWLFTLCVVTVASAQTPPPERGEMSRGNMPANTKVKGIVVEADSGTPMEYANVVIFSARDSSIVGGVMTNSLGEFEIKKLKTGRYFLQADFIGFKKETRKNIFLKPGHPVTDLGIIKLSVTSTELNEVDVVAEKARVEFKIDRRVVNVSQEISAAGGTAVDALKNTPAVDVDIEGNVTVRGSGDFTVLIDGKPSVLSGSDALEQIAASNVENIEIITNPSAKYDPDGVSGIINVVMKKNIKGAFSGLVNVSTGSNDSKSTDVSLNYRTGKFNFLLSGSYQDMVFEGERSQNQQVFDGDTIFYLNSKGNMDRMHSGKSLKAGMDYQVNDKTSVSLSGSIGNYEFVRSSKANLHEYSNFDPIGMYYFSDNSVGRDGDYWNTDLSYNFQFNDKGHQLQALFYVSGRKGDNKDNQFLYNTDADYIPLDELAEKIRTSEVSDENEYRVKLDYTLPFNEFNKFEAGLQSRMERENEQFGLESFNHDVDAWELEPTFSSATDFSRDIISVYSTYAHTTGGLSYQLGLRGEYTKRSLEVGNDDFTVDRFDLFPTVHLSQKFGRELEFMASYSRRINRPRGYWLEPFPTYMDRNNVRIGNPELKPEYTGSYEVSALRRFGTSFISLELYHRHTSNLITRTIEVGEDDIFYQTVDNLNDDYSTGTELMANLQLTKWYRLVASGTLYHYKIKGDLYGESIDNSSTNFNARVNMDFSLVKNTKLQFNSMYRGASASAQGEYDAMFFSSASLRQDFLKNKLSATLQVNDIFGTMKRKGVSTGKAFQNDFEFARAPRTFRFTLSYKLNNFKAKRNGRQGDGGGFDAEEF